MLFTHDAFELWCCNLQMKLFCFCNEKTADFSLLFSLSSAEILILNWVTLAKVVPVVTLRSKGTGPEPDFNTKVYLKG